MNEQLQNRNLELGQSNNDLTNLLGSAAIPVVMLGSDLRIRRFTPSARKVLNLLPTDVGRPIGNIKPTVEVPDLEELLLDVIATVQVREREVRDRDGRWYQLRLHPYRTADNRIDGAVLVLTDTDALKRGEQDAQVARRYAETILRNAPIPLLILRGDLRVNTANEAFYRVFKVRPEETEGLWIYALGSGQWDIPKLRNLLEDILPQNSVFDDYEVTYQFPTIGRRTMRLNARRLERDAGETSLILLAIEDVTEQLEARAAVRSSEIRYRRLFEAAQDGILMLDPVSGKITDANPFMEKLIGYPRDELLGKELWQIGLLQDERASHAALRELQQKGFIRYDNLPLRTRDGRAVHVESVCNLYEEDSRNVIQCNIRDITGRKRAEAALVESEDKYRTLFDSMDQGYCIIQMLYEGGQPVDWRYVEVNPAFEKHNGLANSTGRTMRELAPTIEQKWMRIYGHVAETGKSIRFEEDSPTLDGRAFDLYAFRVGEPGERKVAVLFTDITERKRVETVLEVSEERQAFLLKLSDALRPLADATEIQRTAIHVVGEHFALDRAMYAEITLDGERVVVNDNYLSGRSAPFTGEFPLAAYGPIIDKARRGEPMIVADVDAEAGLTEAERSNYKAIGSTAFVTIPLVKGGRWVSNLVVHQGEPRRWTTEEIALFKEAAERTWAAVERARAEAALRESEEALRRADGRLQVALSAARLDVGRGAGRPRPRRQPEPDARPARDRNRGHRRVVLRPHPRGGSGSGTGHLRHGRRAGRIVRRRVPRGPRRRLDAVAPRPGGRGPRDRRDGHATGRRVRGRDRPQAGRGRTGRKPEDAFHPDRAVPVRHLHRGRRLPHCLRQRQIARQGVRQRAAPHRASVR